MESQNSIFLIAILFTRDFFSREILRSSTDQQTMMLNSCVN